MTFSLSRFTSLVIQVTILISSLFFLCYFNLVNSAYAASERLSPVLQAIDPTQAHLDLQEALEIEPPLAPNFKRPTTGQLANQSVQPPISTTSLGKRIALLEQEIFGAWYAGHDLKSRLENMEREVFGYLNEGSVEERLANLQIQIMGESPFSGRANRENVANDEQSNYGRKSATRIGAADFAKAVAAIPFSPKVSDYFSKIFVINAINQGVNQRQWARWKNFPVSVRLPVESPEIWQGQLMAGIQKWKQYIPILVSQNETVDIDVVWVNHLAPKLLGITRLMAMNGQLKVRIFMLRPSFYLPAVPEHLLERVFLHELGHGLGLFGHSDDERDQMYPIEVEEGKKGGLDFSQNDLITSRDLNTLRKIYESPGLLPDYTTPHPLEWASVCRVYW